MPTLEKPFWQTSMNMQNASNKRTAIGARLAFALLAACSVQPAFAQTERYIAVEDRHVEPARPIASIIAQEHLATSIELGRIIPVEGGLIGALIDNKPETLAQNAATKADRFARPLFEALEGFDVKPLALAATEQTLAQTDWLASAPPEVLSGTSIATARDNHGLVAGDSTVSMTYGGGSFHEEANDTFGALAWKNERQRLEDEFATAHASAQEIAILSWRYQLSADFTNMQVIVDVGIRRPNSHSLSYRQQLISIVKLRRPSFIEEENIGIWAANDAALARRALEMAFSRAGEVLPAILALDEDGYENATNKRRNPPATGAGFHGPQLLRDDKGPVFHARDGDQRLRAFVALQTIRN